MRIASCNLLHGIDVRRLSRGQSALTPDHVDLEAVADWIAGLQADVVVLQEVDRGLARSGEVDQTAWLADRLGCEGVFGPALAGDPDTAWEEVDGAAPDATTTGYGVAILSRVGLVDVRRVRLPHGGPGTRQPGASPTNPGVDGEPRVVLSATVGPAEGVDALRVSTTHLSYMFWRAIPQLGQAMAAASPADATPAVLIGDLNLPMWGGWLALHARGLHPWGWPEAATTANGWIHLAGAATYPSWKPRLQLDQVYTRHLPRPAAVAVGPAGPSDHLPLVIDL